MSRVLLRRGARPGELAAVGQLVNHGRFAHVALARKSHLRTALRGEIAIILHRRDKIRAFYDHRLVCSLFLCLLLGGRLFAKRRFQHGMHPPPG